MKFLVLDPSGVIHVHADAPPPGHVRVPLDGAETLGPFQPFFQLVYFHGIYSAKYREDLREGRKRVAYKLIPPDPWLLALAAVMWEGIIQGLAWDAIKAFCRIALASMQRQHVAPPPTAALAPTPAETVTQRTARFRWTRFASSGRLQYELYLDLKRRYKELPPPQREQLSGALRASTGPDTGQGAPTRARRRKA